MTSSLVMMLAASLGMIAVILGAFGAHYLKNKWTPESLVSFETGVRYQLIHSVVLLFLGFQWEFNSRIEVLIALSFTVGIFFFSFSIYGLTYSINQDKKWRFLGPITPLGGLLLILGWLGILIHSI